MKRGLDRRTYLYHLLRPVHPHSAVIYLLWLMKYIILFHLSNSGVHHKGKGKCDADNLVNQIDKLIDSSTQYLFPENVELSPKTRPIRSKDPKPNGGWGDVRDHALCMTYGQPGRLWLRPHAVVQGYSAELRAQLSRLVDWFLVKDDKTFI